MATAGRSASTLKQNLPFDKLRFAIVISEWNSEVTGALYDGAVDEFVKAGVQKNNILKVDVPGSFELPFAAQRYASQKDIDAVICIGCVIQGETKHFDFISQAVADGVMRVGLEQNKPVIFGVLTPNTHQQALDRAGGKHGNKGAEAAYTALQMLKI